MKERVKISVDFASGKYRVMSYENGSRMTSIVRYGKGSKNSQLNKKNLKDIKMKLESYIMASNYDEKEIKNVDLLLFDTLDSFDKSYNTNYTKEYLSIVLRDYSKERKDFATKSKFKKYCRNDKKRKLHIAGIEVVYRRGIFGIKNLNLLERIKINKMANKSKKYFGAKIIDSLTISEDDSIREIQEFKEKFSKKDSNDQSDVENNNISDDIDKSEEEKLGFDSNSEKYDDLKREFLEQLTLMDEQQKELEIRLEKLKRQRQEFLEQIGVVTNPEKEEEKKEEEKEEEKEEKAHFKRKISELKDSILNKHYIPTSQKNIRIIKGVLKGVVTLFAIGGVVLTIKNNGEEKTNTYNKETAASKTMFDTDDMNLTSQTQDRIQTTVTYTSREGQTQTMTTYITAKPSELKTTTTAKLAESKITTTTIKPVESTTTTTTKPVESTTTTTTKPAELKTTTTTAKLAESKITTTTTKPVESTTTTTTTKPAESTTTTTTTTKPVESTTTTITEPNQSETEVQPSEDNQSNIDTNKTEDQKIEEFRDTAIQTYKEAFIIGEKPNVGDIFKDKTYSQNPDGSGRIGYFNTYQDYSISHINIITDEGWHVVRADGKNLIELLAEYPNCKDYNIHFINSKTGGGLGFVTKSQLDDIINNKINSIIESKMLNNSLELNNILDIDNENLR